MPSLPGLSLFVTGLFVGRDFCVTPPLAFGLLIGLLRKLRNQNLDHLLNFLEGSSDTRVTGAEITRLLRYDPCSRSYAATRSW